MFLWALPTAQTVLMLAWIVNFLIRLAIAMNHTDTHLQSWNHQVGDARAGEFQSADSLSL
jgi:hypothetical protein